MFTFLSYGFGSIACGALSALTVCAFLLLSAYKRSHNRNLNPISLISALVLLGILSYQFTGLIFCLKCKSTVIDTLDTVALTVNLTEPSNDAQLLRELTDRYPAINSFFDSLLLQQINMEAPLESLRTLIASYFNDFILKRVLWAAGATIVFGILIFIPGKNKRKRIRKTTDASCHYGEDFY